MFVKRTLRSQQMPLRSDDITAGCCSCVGRALAWVRKACRNGWLADKLKQPHALRRVPTVQDLPKQEDQEDAWMLLWDDLPSLAQQLIIQLASIHTQRCLLQTSKDMAKEVMSSAATTSLTLHATDPVLPFTYTLLRHARKVHVKLCGGVGASYKRLTDKSDIKHLNLQNLGLTANLAVEELELHNCNLLQTISLEATVQCSLSYMGQEVTAHAKPKVPLPQSFYHLEVSNWQRLTPWLNVLGPNVRELTEHRITLAVFCAVHGLCFDSTWYPDTHHEHDTEQQKAFWATVVAELPSHVKCLIFEDPYCEAHCTYIATAAQALATAAPRNDLLIKIMYEANSPHRSNASCMMMALEGLEQTYSFVRIDLT